MFAARGSRCGTRCARSRRATPVHNRVWLSTTSPNSVCGRQAIATVFSVTPVLAMRPDTDGLLRRSTLLDDGFTAEEIDRLLRTGLLLAVRRGVYRTADREIATAEKEHALRCRALFPQLGGGAFGYVSAAVLLRLPVWNVPLARLHVVQDRSGRGQVRCGVHVHGSPLAARDVVEMDGLRVTSPARTAAEMARSLPLEAALVMVDGALQRAWRERHLGEHHPGATTAAEIDEVMERFVGRRGIPAARRLFALADERSESPGETRSRYAMHIAGLPPPITQWDVPGTDFRTDFGWPELGVVGEFDGKAKYGRGFRRGVDPQELLWREKLREDRIRATGLIVVRWTWSGITSSAPDGLLPQLIARLGR